jgi:HEAT repeat protein
VLTAVLLFLLGAATTAQETGGTAAGKNEAESSAAEDRSPEAQDAEGSTADGRSPEDQTSSEEKEGGKSGDEEEQEELKSLREKRAMTLKYGIDSQILGMIEKLKEERNDKHNEALLEVFDRTTNPKIQSSIAEFFRTIESKALKDTAFERLQEYDDMRPELVTALTAYLEEYQDQEITKLFNEMTEDPRNQVAGRAVRALGASGNDTYTRDLINLYEESSNESMKSAVLDALGKLGNDEALDLLIEEVRDDDNSKSLRWKACIALGKIGNPEALDTIEYLFGEKDPYLRMYAVRALSNFESDEVQTLLMEALRDDHWRVRVSAAESLGTLGSSKAVEILKFKARHDPERNNVAPAAIRSLGTIGGDKAFSFLREVYENDDYSDSLRLTAMRSLIENDLRGSLATLRKVIDEEWEEENSRILEYTCKELSTTENRILQPLYQKMLTHPDHFHIPIYGLRGIRLNGLRALKSEVKKLTDEEHNQHVRELAKTVLDEL